VSRMKAVIGALGINPEKLKVIISQMVTLRRGENVIKLSKRTGELITLRELVEEVGRMPAGSSSSRARRTARWTSTRAGEARVGRQPGILYPVCARPHFQHPAPRPGKKYRLLAGDVSLLNTDVELDLIRKMLLFPEVMELAAINLEPHHLAYFAQEIATSFHSFYKHCRVVTDNEALTCARLKLVEAARIVFSRALVLMGMAAPEKM